jgi:hypothetical protein
MQYNSRTEETLQYATLSITKPTNKTLKIKRIKKKDECTKTIFIHIYFLVFIITADSSQNFIFIEQSNQSCII